MEEGHSRQGGGLGGRRGHDGGHDLGGRGTLVCCHLDFGELLLPRLLDPLQREDDGVLEWWIAVEVVGGNGIRTERLFRLLRTLHMR